MLGSWLGIANSDMEVVLGAFHWNQGEAAEEVEVNEIKRGREIISVFVEKLIVIAITGRWRGRYISSRALFS